jgi:hypothetical protein
VRLGFHIETGGELMYSTYQSKEIPHGLLELRPDDIRLKQAQERSDRVLIFTVDASGSAALARLAEAKGAVELLLAQAYARRDHVALIAFRGDRAEVLLPPTRSLARARRRLADLPGGGGTHTVRATQARAASGVGVGVGVRAQLARCAHVLGWLAGACCAHAGLWRRRERLVRLRDGDFFLLAGGGRR